MKANAMRQILQAEGITGLADKIDLAVEFKEASVRLGMIGLSPYESMTYIALVAHGFGDAETIAETAGIPRTSSYKVLQSLQRKGFAIATSGRPVIYKPEAPSKMREMVEAQIRETFEKLELLHDIVGEKGEPQLVYTITGRKKVLAKIGEMLDMSASKFLISSPVFAEIRDELGKKLSNAIQRGVEVTVITAPFQRVRENVKVVRNSSLIATDVISDEQRALLASLDLNACGYTDNPELSHHLLRFLEILISSSQGAKAQPRK
jgi:sugar-specific transcriptional regulator TrmB